MWRQIPTLMRSLNLCVLGSFINQFVSEKLPKCWLNFCRILSMRCFREKRPNLFAPVSGATPSLCTCPVGKLNRNWVIHNFDQGQACERISRFGKGVNSRRVSKYVPLGPGRQKNREMRDESQEHTFHPSWGLKTADSLASPPSRV